MLMRLRLAVLLLVLAATPTWARAEGLPEDRHRVLPCRPTVSCTADLVPPGSLEIEAGYSARRARPKGFVHAEPLLLKFTALDWLQLQVGANGHVFTTGQVSRSLRYLDDIAFGLKVRFFEQTRSRPSFAVSAHLSIPSWDPHPDFPKALDAAGWAYLSKDIGVFHFDLNGGANVWQFDRKDSYAQPFVTLASAAALPRGFGTLLEAYYFADAAPISPRDGGILMGLTYSPRPWLMFDVGGDLGMFPSTRAFTLFAGFTIVPYDFYDTARERRGLAPQPAPRAPVGARPLLGLAGPGSSR